MSFFIEHVEGLYESIDDLAKLEITFEQLLKQKLLELLESIVAEARSNLQNNPSVITGDLNASLQVLSYDANRYEGEVGTELEYAIYVEYGRPEIYPVVAKVLHWIDPDTGEDRFSHYSPPTQAQPFLEPAVIVKTEEFADIIVHRIDDELQRLHF
jgi:hypothetical protein